MKLEEIVDMIKDMNSSGVIEYRQDNGKESVLIKKKPVVIETVEKLEGIAVPQKKLQEGIQEEEKGTNAVYIESPIVGVFHIFYDVSKPPYIRKEVRVQKGQVLCQITAMNLIREIYSPVSGYVVEILMDEGTPVEYGQKLIKIRKE
ncbi:MAG: hypothetical protein A2X49_15100 [Lentisphaerae bacterium GWF2_52_8]|nr:MAG: hypothetical protein A2X49_15100 [Lentisphaerae bacterium GWF2_52_8]